MKEDDIVNKSQLIDQIAADADISKAAAGRALDSFIEAVSGALKDGDSVALVGFGTSLYVSAQHVQVVTRKLVKLSRLLQQTFLLSKQVKR